jgi:two-component system cell cycle response regulator
VRHLYDVLGPGTGALRRQGLPVSLAFLDLDRFKLVNDAHGHLVGSELLALHRPAAAGAEPQARLCFRYGGDEFVILMPETAPRRL